MSSSWPTSRIAYKQCHLVVRNCRRGELHVVVASKWVYPQSDVSLAIVDIDASKGFVDLWVHLALPILANFDVKKQLKRLSTKI